MNKKTRSDINKSKRYVESVLQKFITCTTINPFTECILWQRACDTKGYGLIAIKLKLYKAHRIFYQLFIGEIPKGLQLDHLCEVKNCVNPFHLEIVTNQENTQRYQDRRKAKNV